MSLLADRVLETATATIGTGNVTLVGAVTGYQTFGGVYAVGDSNIEYYIEAVDANGNATGQYESGFGTYSATNTLQRDTVKTSSNSNALVNFSAGTCRVGHTHIADSIQTMGRVLTMVGGGFSL